jgi:hypothetical protein
VAKDIVCTFASHELVVNNREATKVVRIDRKNIKREL